MSRTPRTVLLVLVVAAVSVATAATAMARPWPDQPLPEALPETVPTAEVVSQAATGASPLWHFLIVAAVASLVAGAAAYVAASRRGDPQRAGGSPSLQVGEASLG